MWVQQALLQTVFVWKFWEKAERSKDDNLYLKQGAEAKVCETTLFVNTVGRQYIAARAKIELACDSLRAQGLSISACVGLADGVIHPASDCDNHIAKSLLTDISNTWRTMVTRATPSPSDLFQEVHPHHQVLLSCKPHRPGCHQWRPAQTTLAEEVRELNADVIVECYLDANANVANLLEDDNIVTVENAETDEYNLSASINDNFKELDRACPEWQPDTQAVHPKWLEHHQSGHLTKDKNCPVCAEEAGSRVAHWRKKGDRQTGVMHVDHAAFEPSADDSKYCLVAAVTMKL